MQKIRRAGYLLVFLMLAAITAAWAWRPAPPAHYGGLSSVAVPGRIGSYIGYAKPVDAQTRSQLSSADIISEQFRSGAGGIIDVDMIGGTDRSALHDPRSCLVGAGWSIGSDRVEQLGSNGHPAVRCCIARLEGTAAHPGYGYDIVYYYVSHRRVIASATSIRLALLESSLLEQNDAPIYFIRLMTPLIEGQGHAAEHSSLMQFASSLWTQVSPSITKEESE